VLRWALHNFLWYFIGLSAVLIHKDVLTKEYIQAWRVRGVRVFAWTVKNSLQRGYLTKFFRVTILSDTMDAIPQQDLLIEGAPPLTARDQPKIELDEGQKFFPDVKGDESK